MEVRNVAKTVEITKEKKGLIDLITLSIRNLKKVRKDALIDKISFDTYKLVGDIADNTDKMRVTVIDADISNILKEG